MNNQNVNEIIKSNSDFLFIYEASMTNPNGDPDQENKPRMDYDTRTNLVTDVRLKRYIRDYLRDVLIEPIFVDMSDDEKVASDTRLYGIINDLIKEEDNKKKFEVPDSLWSKLKEKGLNKQVAKELKKEFGDDFNKLLELIIKSKLIDIRMFGGAFAVEGFSRTYTGPIQINWGYSFNEVVIEKSNSIVTIMNDDSSTFGKDYRVRYSLLGFHGTISKNMAQKTSFTVADMQKFRDAIIKSIPSNPTRSKSNQYPVLFLQIEYKENYNGFLKDLRAYVTAEPRDKKDYAQVRKYSDLNIDYLKLKTFIENNEDIIKAVHIWKNEEYLKDFSINFKSSDGTSVVSPITITRLEDK